MQPAASWTSGHVRRLMLVLLSLASREVWRTQCSSWCAVLIYPRTLEQKHPESASGGSAFERKAKIKPRGPARGLHAIVTAVAGMVDPDSVSCIYDSGLLRCSTRKEIRAEHTYVSL